MSMELMVKAMKAKVGNPLRKLVLIKLADNASDTGECWPSYQHVADQCEIDRRTAMRHIDALEACGFVRKEKRFGGLKGNSSNMFYLTIENGRPSVTESLGSVTESLGGSVTESPRTSHSFEPVKEPLSDAKQPTEKIPTEQIMNLYNQVCAGSFKKALTMTGVRERNIKACWKYKVKGKQVFRSAGFWKAYFEHCLKNSHWLGQNDRGWTASLEFVTRKDVMERTVESLLLEMGVDSDAA